jgi:hypothetical protein
MVARKLWFPWIMPDTGIESAEFRVLSAEA